MEDSGNLLYIIVMLIAAVVGLVGSKKKKPQPTEVLGSPIPPEEWLQDMPSSSKATSSPQKNKIKVKKVEKKSSPSRINIAVPVTENNPLDADENEELCVSAENFRDIVEVKKAIIYSEIFNRKY
ncbi:MAG: hypothetical protein LBH04_08125 [Tannerellaceae bacterium]|jgi:hypothetical protein|nr:hypothetical protein [Tannerellaceae bacterium]